MLYKPVIIEQIHEEAEGFKTFSFKSGHGVQYKAGQYITLTRQTAHEEIRRSYSIISSPLLNEPLTIGVKRIENGAFSRQLIDHAKVGDRLLSIGAGGLFTLPDDTSYVQQIFFLAAGTGITPVISLLKTVLEFHPHIHVVLIYSNASIQKTIFLSELNVLKERFSQRFHLQFLFSDSLNLSFARLNRELLNQLMQTHSICKLDKILFYICGPESYMRMCTYTLQEQKIPKENVRKENFIIQFRKIPKNDPPDRHNHIVTIQYDKEQYELMVQYPDTILQAAKKMNLVLPYSCETGRCGSCVAKCIEGNVWLSYNEVLTEKDIQNGLTLTCVGHPYGGDVQLKI